jgi:hypothetical protein
MSEKLGRLDLILDLAKRTTTDETGKGIVLSGDQRFRIDTKKGTIRRIPQTPFLVPRNPPAGSPDPLGELLGENGALAFENGCLMFIPGVNFAVFGSRGLRILWESRRVSTSELEELVREK